MARCCWLLLNPVGVVEAEVTLYGVVEVVHFDENGKAEFGRETVEGVVVLFNGGGAL